MNLNYNCDAKFLVILFSAFFDNFLFFSTEIAKCTPFGTYLLFNVITFVFGGTEFELQVLICGSFESDCFSVFVFSGSVFEIVMVNGCGVSTIVFVCMCVCDVDFKCVLPEVIAFVSV